MIDLLFAHARARNEVIDVNDRMKPRTMKWSVLMAIARAADRLNLLSMSDERFTEIAHFHGATPLHRAAKVGNIRQVRWLLEHGAEPSLWTKNTLGYTRASAACTSDLLSTAPANRARHIFPAAPPHAQRSPLHADSGHSWRSRRRSSLPCIVTLVSSPRPIGAGGGIARRRPRRVLSIRFLGFQSRTSWRSSTSLPSPSSCSNRNSPPRIGAGRRRGDRRHSPAFIFQPDFACFRYVY